MTEFSKFRKWHDDKYGNSLLKLIELFPLEAKENYYLLLQNPNITWGTQLENVLNVCPTILTREKYWWYVANPNCTPEFINIRPEFKERTFSAEDMFFLSWNPSVTWEFVENNPNLTWKYYWLSCNPNITWKIIRDNPDKEWDYKRVSCNPNITWEIVRNNPTYDWDYNWLSINPNITFEIVQNNKEFPWNYSWFSLNPNITPEIVKNHPEFPWDYRNIMKNPNTTWDHILTGYTLDTDISENPNINWRIVKNNKNLFINHIQALFKNKFLHDPIVCKNRYNRFVRKRKMELSFLFNKILCQDVVEYLLDFVEYD